MDNFPKIQTVDGKLSIKEARELVLGINQLIRAVKGMEQKLAKELKPEKPEKPEKIDLKPVIEAINKNKPEKVSIDIPKPLKEIKVTNLDEIVKTLQKWPKSLKIEQPAISLPEYPKSVTVGNLEALETILASVLSSVEDLNSKEQPETDLSPLIEAVESVKSAVDDIRIPINGGGIPKDESGRVVTTNTATQIVTGTKTVTTGGTAVALTVAPHRSRKVDITAFLSNTGVIYVGDSTVLASTKNGIPLSAGDTYTLEIDDPAKIFIDTTVNGEGVSFNYLF